ncbi:MAG: flippase-like domain-containing protein, partial [Bacteriovoracaceae bacterium]|nr:flippase-like domain-containing protein [Bacteriovoracaceae bacterium]
MIKTLLKIIFAGSIIWWLFSKGHLDFGMVPKVMAMPQLIAVMLGFLLINLAMTSYRWKLLLEIKASKKLPFGRITWLTWVGIFFSTFLPGAVTGDIIKLVYARELDDHLNKTFLVTSALFDRILGMFGLLFIMGSTSLFYYRDLIEISPKIAPLLHFNFLLCLGMVVFYITIFIPHHYQVVILRLVGMVPKIGQKLKHLFEQVWLIGHSKKTVLITTVMSIISQTGNVFAFWFLTAPFYSTAVAFKYTATFIPLGLISVAIPISPSGMGVGHVAFKELYELIGVTGGASLFNLYILAMISFNLVGVIPYLMIGKKKNIGKQIG